MTRHHGVICGLLAAALFGASTPLSKLLLPGVSPLMLAGLLYLGAGLGLSLFRLLPRSDVAARREAQIRWSDLPLLSGIILTGGIIGPILMLTGLVRLSAISGALLLNLETPFTMLLAVFFFREHLERREAAAALLVVLGAASLAYRPGDMAADWIGTLAIVGACLSWAIDNNLTQRMSVRDPAAVARVKTVGAGICTSFIALATGHGSPDMPTLLAALATGSVCYGLSLVLATYALRHLGAARESALFATAPFAGALLAIPLLHESPVPIDYAASGIMILGVILLLRVRHGHVHAHTELMHDHLHIHDEHHQHPHDGEVREPHSHLHRHVSMTHAHAHASDIHHRHGHSRTSEA